jgi:hypothetical protein
MNKEVSLRQLTEARLIKNSSNPFGRRRNIQKKNILQNDIQENDVQHNDNPLNDI